MSYLHRRLGALILPAAALLLNGQAIAQTPPPHSSAFLGTWELDLSRMPEDYGPAPRRVLYTFEDAGAGQWRTKIDITAQDGGVRHMAVQYRRDGRMAPGEGDTGEADSAAFNSPASDVLVMSLAKDKRLGSVRVYALSADGSEMTESAANVNGDGAPFVRNFHFTRLR